jgi:hypothetical protein
MKEVGIKKYYQKKITYKKVIFLSNKKFFLKKEMKVLIGFVEVV